MTPSPLLQLDRLGRSNAAALRNLFDAFEERGWSRVGSDALDLVYFLESGRNRSRSAAVCARSLSSGFLARNRVSRGELVEFFVALSARSF
jgi:hypothetical protein